MNRRWSWAPLPSRLLTDPRMLLMSLETRAVMMSCYAGFDEHGRAHYGEVPLRVTLAIVDGTNVLPFVDRLVSAGLLHRYGVDDAVYLAIDRFDEDDTSGSFNRRPKSMIPPQSIASLLPIDSQSTANSATGPDRTGPNLTQVRATDAGARAAGTPAEQVAPLPVSSETSRPDPKPWDPDEMWDSLSEETLGEYYLRMAAGPPKRDPSQRDWTGME